jgi:hypothetical protein
MKIWKFLNFNKYLKLANIIFLINNVYYTILQQFGIKIIIFHILHIQLKWINLNNLLIHFNIMNG